MSAERSRQQTFTVQDASGLAFVKSPRSARKTAVFGRLVECSYRPASGARPTRTEISRQPLGRQQWTRTTAGRHPVVCSRIAFQLQVNFVAPVRSEFALTALRLPGDPAEAKVLEFFLTS